MRFIRDFKPDIIYYWDPISFVIALEARLFFKTVLVDGSIRYAEKRDLHLAALALKKLSYTIANKIVSNSQAGLVVEGLNGKDKSAVIHNGIDFGRFVSPDSQDTGSSDLDANTIKIVMVASFRPAKDHMILIHAAEVLFREKANVQVVLIGDGPTKDRVELAIPEAIRNKVIFLGMRVDVEMLLKSCDIGVLFSTNAEGLSNSIMEYMASGLPVVATRTGGNPELISDGETGYLVDNSDLDLVAGRLRTLVDNPALRLKMGEAGRKRIQSEFSIDKMIEKHLKLYQELVPNRK
jgi:glycosyltransferase involved in cell wall biosynthesis